ncbi:MAG TPA: thiamine-phosphate kinase, partial [Acidimicrobiales bacterium]|nr:thiamine-phosphate kinase [Acidimicrobiales bacterium]
WVGDDAAVLRPPTGDLLLAVDTVVAGVHADLALVGLDDLGWKALAVNVSDVAAMGGRPHRAVVSVGLPAGTDLDLLYEGLAEAALAMACPVVGGDLTSCPEVVVTVAVTGSVPAGQAVHRSGAGVGDRIYVTGPLGGSAAGLEALRRGPEPADAGVVAAHRRPAPRVEEGEAARVAGATAMIDVSDGLAIDLWRLVTESAVGAVLEEVPAASGAGTEAALSGGEDYELVFTAPDGDAVGAEFARRGLRPPVIIGRIVDGDGVMLGGLPLEPRGYVHDL